MFGTIVLVRFPFTDLSGEKRSPALVVSRDNQRRDDLVACFVTSVLRPAPDAVRLDAVPETGLKTASMVRFDKLATLHRSVVSGALGRAPAEWLNRHAPLFHGVFGLPPGVPGPGGKS